MFDPLYADFREPRRFADHVPHFVGDGSSTKGIAMTETELSPRQREIMQCLVDGLSFKMIADKLGMQSGTAKKHAMRAREKVGAKSLYQCIAILVARGEIVPADIIVDHESF